jgi:hypothetical protein
MLKEPMAIAASQIYGAVVAADRVKGPNYFLCGKIALDTSGDLESVPVNPLKPQGLTGNQWQSDGSKNFRPTLSSLKS